MSFYIKAITLFGGLFLFAGISGDLSTYTSDSWKNNRSLISMLDESDLIMELGCSANLIRSTGSDEIVSLLDSEDSFLVELVALKLNLSLNKGSNFGQYRYINSSSVVSGLHLNEIMYVANQVHGGCLPFQPHEIHEALLDINQMYENAGQNPFLTKSSEN